MLNKLASAIITGNNIFIPIFDMFSTNLLYFFIFVYIKNRQKRKAKNIISSINTIINNNVIILYVNIEEE